MAQNARSAPPDQTLESGVFAPLTGIRRIALAGLAWAIGITLATMVATRTAVAFLPFLPVLVPAAVATLAITIFTRIRETKVKSGEILPASPPWEGTRGPLVAVLGIVLTILGGAVVDLGLFWAFSSITYWGEPQTATQEWQEAWGFKVSGAGGIAAIVGSTLYAVAAIEASTARVAQLQRGEKD